MIKEHNPIPKELNVKNQVKHHKTETFIDEYKRLLKEFKIEFDEKYLL